MRKSPPKLLGEAIKRQRLVPRDFRPPEFDLDRLIWDSELGIQTWGLEFLGMAPGSGIIRASPALVRAKRDFDEIVLTLPTGLKRLLRGRARRGKTLGERFYYMACDYDEFCKERSALFSIAMVASQKGAALQIPEVRLKTVAEGGKGKWSFEIDSHPLYNEVVNREVEPSYIRECEIQKCRKIFWAGRIEQIGCSPTCQRALRDRRYLDKKNKRTQSDYPHRGPTKHEKMARVRNALNVEGMLTRDEISKRTVLSLDEVSEAIGDLNEQFDQIESQVGAAGERLFYISRSAKKGK